MKVEEAKELVRLINRLSELEEVIDMYQRNLQTDEMHTYIKFNYATGPHAGGHWGTFHIDDVEVLAPLFKKWEAEKNEIVNRLKELGVEL